MLCYFDARKMEFHYSIVISTNLITNELQFFSCLSLLSFIYIFLIICLLIIFVHIVLTVFFTLLSYLRDVYAWYISDLRFYIYFFILRIVTLFLPHMPVFISHVKYLFLSFPCDLWFPNKDLPHSNYSDIYVYFCLACLWLHFSYLSFIFLMLFWMRIKDPLYNFGCL